MPVNVALLTFCAAVKLYMAAVPALEAILKLTIASLNPVIATLEPLNTQSSAFVTALNAVNPITLEAIAVVSVGYCVANSPTALAIFATVSIIGVITGISPLPIVICAASILFFISSILLAVVSALAENSACILPA